MIGMVHKKLPMIDGAGLGSPIVHGQGLGSPIAHGNGLGVPITPVYGFGDRRWKGYESLYGAGLGVSDSDLDAMARAVAAKGWGVSSHDIAGLMKGMSQAERETFAAKLIAAGVDVALVTAAKVHVLSGDAGTSGNWGKFWAIASTVSMAASAYHGYKRNNSIGWGLGWGLLGALFPVITPTFALAQGFGQPKGQLRGALGGVSHRMARRAGVRI